MANLAIKKEVVSTITSFLKSGGLMPEVQGFFTDHSDERLRDLVVVYDRLADRLTSAPVEGKSRKRAADEAMTAIRLGLMAKVTLLQRGA